MTVVFSGLFRELIITKPKPSFSFRLMTTSLVCRAEPSGGEVVAAAFAVMGTGAEAASLRGELCCVDTEPGLRPFTGQGSPEGKERKRATVTLKHLPINSALSKIEKKVLRNKSVLCYSFSFKGPAWKIYVLYVVYKPLT